MDNSKLPRVVINEDNSFNVDPFVQDIKYYHLGYYHSESGMGEDINESTMWLPIDDYIGFVAYHGTEEFISVYGKQPEQFKPMLYRIA